jgi:putative PIN family toxin of toxin-antitoxin system
MHKVIIDTNIWISFLISKSLVGLHKFIYDNRIQLITCNEQLEELLEVLGREKMKKYFIKEQV